MADNNATIQTEGVTDLVSAGAIAIPQDMDLSQMRRNMERLEQWLQMRTEFIQRNLTFGKDYGPIPGCGTKNAMLKPAAEKLNFWFGSYGLCCETGHVENHDEPYFEYRYRCEIRQKGTSILLGWAERECNTKEARWGRVNPFDIKDNCRAKAQKRAFIAATKLATATSDIFAEEEELQRGSSSGSDQAGTSATMVSNYKGLIKRTMKSKYGDPNKKSRCGFCGEFHILKDDEIVGVDGPDNKTVYGLEECLARTWAAEHPAAPEEKQAPAEATPAEQPAPVAGAVLSVSHIKALNAAIHDAKKSDVQFMVWLAGLEAKYAGRSINDILQSDFDRIVDAWDKALAGGKV